MRESSGGPSSSSRSTTQSSTAKGSANSNADFLSRLPEPGTEPDRSGSTSLHPVEDSGIYLVRACGLSTPSSQIPGVGLGGFVPRTESTALGGLVPRTESATLGGLPLSSTGLWQGTHEAVHSTTIAVSGSGHTGN